jgi:hypothetical protein
MIGASARRRILPAVAALVILLRALASLAQEGDERVVPNWVPSIGLGFGLQSREINGTIDAILFEGTTGPPPSTSELPCQTIPPTLPPPFPPVPGFCNASGDDNTASDGGALDVSAQILGPPWKSAPWNLRPRPFVHAGWADEFDSRTIVETGEIPSAFDNNPGQPDLHVRLRANPNTIWYAGGGVALQMPIHFTPVFVKIGGHYLEERMDAVGSIDRGLAVAANQTEVFTTQNARGMTIRGAGPSFGVEAEIWRFGPVALQFVADLLVTFPLSGSKTSFDLDEPVFGGDPPSCRTNPAPCNPPAHFDFDADNPSYFGIASLRFGWVGY